MNVRFFLRKHWETLAGALLDRSEVELQSNKRVHHLRFLQEARIATPISGYIGVVEMPSGQRRYSTELRQSFTDEVLSACLHEVGPEPNVVTDTLADHNGPRGLADASSQYIGVAYGELSARGFVQIGAGRISASECSEVGVLSAHGFMGRLSDSMPHLWGAIHVGGVLDEAEGGAVLEYRLEYFNPLHAENSYEIWSGLRGVGPKRQEFIHLMFAEGGKLVLAAEAVGVRLDLIARKAKTLSEGVQSEMRSRIVRAPDQSSQE
ncbi:MAG: hypothetical protein GKR90_03800 [Pseudomonadales bacterium]|nr:hypothetical protein [Pseudomonadales bacterium]